MDTDTSAVEPNVSVEDRRTQRFVSLIWILLFFNVLNWIGVPTVIPIPQRVAQLLTMGALAMSILLALSLNSRLLIRPNVVLTLFSLLAVLSLATTVRGTAGVGGVLRCFRLMGFLTVLWLLSPWWGRRDLLLARCHLRALLFVCGTVVLGLLIAPPRALAVGGRLSGVIWPIWPTAVAHFSALAAGMTIVLWLSGSTSGRRALLLGGGGIAMVLLSQTRASILGLLAGLICATFSLYLVRRRVRRAMTVALLVAPLGVVLLAPAFSVWFTRGQSPEELSGLTGRKQVWVRLLDEPRSEFTQWFGSGLSDKGFAGLPIDNSWLAVYQDQGLLGVVIVAAILLFLLVSAAFREGGPARALAIFIVVYCGVDSYTEVGLGDASPYLLDLVVAASLLLPSPASDDSVAP